MTDQITPALCRELGMEHDGHDVWSIKFGCVTVKVYMVSRTMLVMDSEIKAPTAPNLRSLIAQLTPHEEWLRGRLRELGVDELRSLSSRFICAETEHPVVECRSVHSDYVYRTALGRAAAIIAGGES